ncbi:histone-like nucleoid-structuring protein Lsr2 [Nocardia bovistercoris]|uniref:Lsr2 family protein n=1 Tax=Nocardia bovistercoris TaxID=2785916 RepID=A0A931IGD5_9NOCA|nr:Lsr2 family protein [Nocardia bovistercoris]MBH0779275.1 Lsr2 family protein [Nocardia bovistercoris]
MAEKVTVTLVDDFDGTSIADETVQFSLDGVDYEIDLSTPNATELRHSLELWVDKARRTGGRTKRSLIAKTPSAADRERSAIIRDWARRNGHPVSARGRVASGVVEAYERATA